MLRGSWGVRYSVSAGKCPEKALCGSACSGQCVAVQKFSRARAPPALLLWRVFLLAGSVQIICRAQVFVSNTGRVFWAVNPIELNMFETQVWEILWLFAVAISPSFSCPLVTAFVGSSSHFSLLQGTQAKQTSTVRCALFSVHCCHSVFIKSRKPVPEGGRRILPSCYLWCSGGIFRKGCWRCCPQGWLREGRSGGSQMTLMNCREGVTPAKMPLVDVCVRTSVRVYTQTDSEPTDRKRPEKELESPLLAAAIWQPFTLRSTQFLYRKTVVTWNGFSMTPSFRGWTRPPNVQAPQDLCVANPDYHSVFWGRKVEPCCALVRFASYTFLWSRRSQRAVGEGGDE